MEEDNVELFDYFRVIWTRKILIIVVILVCIAVGVVVVVMNSRLKLPVTYHADVVVKIGQRLSFSPTRGISPAVVYIEPPESLVETLPFKHGFEAKKAKETHGYHLEVKQIGKLSMLELILKGFDGRVERVLKEVVDMMIDEHNRKTEASIVSYTSFMRKLEADVQMYQENIAVAEASIKEIKRRGVVHLENIVAAEAETKKGESGGGRSAFMNMLYLKTIDLERDLRGSRNDLRNTQWQLMLYHTSMGDREKYNTALVGEIRSATTVSPKKKGAKSTIIVAGVAGLIMSLFIAFFMEYLEESKSKRKGKR